MTSWITTTRYLVLDMESTGLDPEQDRAVAAALAVFQPEFPDLAITRTWLIDPGVEIPAAATAVHGITTADVRAYGQPARYALAEISDVLDEHWTADVPLVVFNAPFDLSLLDRELGRHFTQELSLGGPVIDPLCLHRTCYPTWSESRSLGALCRVFGVSLDRPHDAHDDAVATGRLLRALVGVVGYLGALSPHDLDLSQSGWHDRYCRARYRELDQRAAAATDPEERERLRRRAVDYRLQQYAWPLRRRDPREQASTV